MCGNNLFWVLTRISHEWAKRTSEISCLARGIISYFQTSMYCSVYYNCKKIVLLSHKNRAVYFNMFYDNQHMWDYQSCTFYIITTNNDCRNNNLQIAHNNKIQIYVQIYSILFTVNSSLLLAMGNENLVWNKVL